MMTLQINVPEETITRYGAAALTERLEKLVVWEEFSARAQRIDKALRAAGIDNEAAMKEARKRAWQKYKHKIKDKLPPEAFEEA